MMKPKNNSMRIKICELPKLKDVVYVYVNISNNDINVEIKMESQHAIPPNILECLQILLILILLRSQKDLNKILDSEIVQIRRQEQKTDQTEIRHLKNR